MKKIMIIAVLLIAVAAASAGALKVDAVNGDKITVDGVDDEWSGRLCCSGEGELGFAFTTDEDGMLNIALYPRTETLKRKAGMKGMTVTLYDPSDEDNKIVVTFEGMDIDNMGEPGGEDSGEIRTGSFENGNGTAEMSLSREKCFAEISLPVTSLPLNKSNIMMKVDITGITKDDMESMGENMPGDRPSDGDSSMGGRPSGGMGGRPSGGMGGRPGGGRGGRSDMSQSDDMKEMSEDYEMIFKINLK